MRFNREMSVLVSASLSPAVASRASSTSFCLTSGSFALAFGVSDTKLARLSSGWGFLETKPSLSMRVRRRPWSIVPPHNVLPDSI
jgi:hypothetical protein